ncbi:chemotaxis protein CheW [Pseudorhodoferax sp. Leaf274]|uniref:chemotaxis protein CheW n=1 Tax=Pseudorhodoferax sp. Leaf274 TaxID=1736318 RepID=UPI000A4FF44C|nr:chemotaxis protein CheW [Pseudorhodoferax sp. Leaf274]
MAPHDTAPTLPPAHWLAVQAGGQRCLVPLAQAGEIFPWTAVQPTPYTRAWFLGVANLRGDLCGVVDLGRFLQRDAPRSEDTATPDAKLLGFHPAIGLNCALRIDRLLGLRSADAFGPAAPGTPDVPAWLGPQHTDAEGLVWQTLDLQALAHSPAFLAIDA